MTISTQLNEISKLTLVASDAAYKGNNTRIGDAGRPGELLAEFRDTPDYDFRVPYAIPPGFFAEAKGEDPRTGFKFVAYRKTDILSDEVVIAISGTDGQDFQDWAANLRLGWEQWDRSGAGRTLVFNYLDSLRDASDPSQSFAGKMHFTGQSLGGALAEYAALEYFESRRAIESDVAQRITLTTFNGLGSRDGLTLHGNKAPEAIAAFDNAMRGVDRVAHYYVTNDLVSRLGGGHIGGPEYQLNFVSDRFDPRTNQPLLLNPLEAHRIETGFYREFARRSTESSGADFTLAELRPLEQIDTKSIQPLVGAFVALFNNRATTQATAEYRLKGSLIAALKDANVSDISRVLDPTLDALFESGVMTGDVYLALKKEGIAFLRAASNARARDAGRYLLTALAMEKADLGSTPSQAELDAVRQVLGPGYVSNELGAAFYGPGNAARLKRSMAILSGSAVIYANNAGDRELLTRLDVNPDDVARIVLTSEPAGPALGRYLFDRAVHGQIGNAATIITSLIKFETRRTLESAAKALANFRDVQASAAKSFYDDIKAGTAELISDVAKGIGNAFIDLSRKASGVSFDLQRELSFSLVKAIRDLLGEAEGDEKNSDAREIYRAARLSIENAGQAVALEILTAKPSNPFESANFDPNSHVTASDQLLDQDLGTYSLFLPYEAGEGGQRIRLKLEGVSADRLAAFSDGEEIEPELDSFELSVPEGRRHVSFVLVADDALDQSGMLSISATLVDPDGVPTHQTHVEANLTVEHDSQPPIEVVVNGPTHATGVLDGYESHQLTANEPTLHRTRLVGTPSADWVVGNHAAEEVDAGAGSNLIFEAVTQGLGTDPFREADTIKAGDGNDLIFGNLGGSTIGTGDGDNLVKPYTGPGLWVGQVLPSQPDIPIAPSYDFSRFYADFASGIAVEKVGDAPIAKDDGVLDLPFRLVLKQSSGTSQFLKLGPDREAAQLSTYTVTPNDDGSATIQYFGDEASVTYRVAFIAELTGDFFPQTQDRRAAVGPWTLRLLDNGSVELKYHLFPTAVILPGADWVEGYITPEAVDPLTIEAGSGEDHLFGGQADDVIRSGEGDDRVAGYAGHDTLLGGGGNDLMIAGIGDDYVDAGAGADRVWGEAGSDVLIGGDGSDILTGDSATAPIATHGDDFLDGGGGDDILIGNGGHDEIYGGDGDDQVAGDEGDDYLYGEAGNDSLSAGSGNNMLDGGAGDDQLEAGDGKDYLDGGDGDDTLIAAAGDDTLLGGNGNDSLGGNGGNDFLDGELGDDVLAGEDGDDTLVGGVGSDQLTGGDGSDNLEGGAGSDLLVGGEGNDVYRFDLGDGVDTISDASGLSVVEFGAGISVTGLEAQFFGTLFELQYAAGDGVRIGQSGMNLVDYRFRFADGTQWTTQELMEAALPAPVQIAAGDADTALFGSRFDDALVGGAGNDVLRASAGNDILAGGAGDDSLNGGSGDDTYIFGLGDGIDRIEDLSGNNTLEFGAGITLDMLTLRPGSLRINIGDGGDAVYLERFDASNPEAGADVQNFHFADGSALSLVELLARGYISVPEVFLFTPGMGERTIARRALISEIRVAPPFLREDIQYARDGTALVIAGRVSDRLRIADWFENSSATRPGVLIESHDTFIDPASITAASLRVNGSPASETLSGLDGFGDRLFGEGGNDRLFGLSGGDQLFGGDGNDLLDGADGTDFLSGDAGANFFAGGPGDDFVDAGFNPAAILAFRSGDGADQIAGVAGTLSIGGNLSPHELVLSRDADDLVLLANADDSLRLLGWFAEGAAADAVSLQVFGNEGVRTYDFTLLAARFQAMQREDPEITQWTPGASIEQALIGVSADQAFGGALAHQYAINGNADALTAEQVDAVLSDAAFGHAAQSFVLAPPNRAPRLTHPLEDQTAGEDSPFSFEVGELFFDEDGDALAYAATLESGTALPSWLTFDRNAGVLEGTPLQSHVGVITLRVTATDSEGLSASDVFSISIEAANDAPVVSMPLASRSFEAGALFVFAVPPQTFDDSDPGDSLSLSASMFNGGPLPQWLRFDSMSGTFTGDPRMSNIGVTHVAVRATDTAGESAVADFGLVVRAAAGATVTGAASDDVLYGGSGDETLKAKGGNDYLYGDSGDDLLRGGGGSDVLQGGIGDDTLRGGTGQNVLEGGVGDDVIYGGQGSGFLAGGAGNDVLRVGQGNDLIAFNLGDGVDVVYGGRDGGNTLSFGGGIGYDDLNFSKVGRDLIVNVSASDRVVLKNWYAGNTSVLNLQLIHDAAAEFDASSDDPLYNRKVQTFDFLGLVGAFDAARAASPGLTSWALTNALLQWHLSRSDDTAIGGDLAYWYGKNGGLGGISIQAAQEVIGASGFGSDAQTLRPFAGLQEGFAKLA